MSDPIGTVLSCGPVESIPDASLTGPVVWGVCPCWCDVELGVDGTETHVCGCPNQTLPCHVTFEFAGGVKWKYTLPCSGLAEAQGKVIHAGTTWTIYNAATRERVA